MVFKELNLYISRTAKRIDNNILGNFIDFFARINVIFALIFGFIDKWLIDGLVKLVVWTIGKIGAMTKTIQLGNAQSFVTTAILGFILLFTSLFYFLY